MIDTVGKIINTILTDIAKIQIANGYDNSIAEVLYGSTERDEVINYPSACVYENAPVALVAEQESTEYDSITIAIEVHLNCTPENLLSKKRSMFLDLNRLFSNDDSILSVYRTDLNKSNIPELKHVSNPFQDSTKEHFKNSQTVGILLQIEYITDRKNVGGSNSTYNIPNVLNNYALTSTTDYLQNEIDSLSAISISGINTWGTIEGSLSAQTDLYNELNSKSLTSHTHSEYFLNSLTGTLTGSPVNLSGYSLTSHSHNSFTSLTSNLLQSNNIITPSGSSTNLPITFRRAGGTTGYEGFYSIGSGVGVICNYAYANAFLDNGFITKKIMLDTDMWNSDITIYEKNAGNMAFTTNSTDRLLITSGGNISISGTLTTIQDVIANGISLTGHTHSNYLLNSLSGDFSLTGHTHSFDNLSDISTVPKTFSVLDSVGLPVDHYKEGDFCIVYQDLDPDKRYTATYIAVNEIIGEVPTLSWVQIKG